MTDRPKLLWHSNAGWAPTGYGQQTGLFAPRLNEHYDVRVSSFYGLEGGPLEWQGVKVLPGLGGTFGNESLPYHVRRFFGEPRGGMVVSLMDVWVLDPTLCSTFDMACWVPVDHLPAPPRVLDFFRKSQTVPLAMSRFGEEQLAEFDPIYVPHGVDTSVYGPHDQAEVRAKLGIPEDQFLVGMVAANKGNPSRKSFVAALEAFAEFRRTHEDAVLYLHTDLEGVFSAGVPLGPVIASLGIPEDAIKHPDPYSIHFAPLPPATMAMVYNALDVLLSPSTGEGFGIPIMEAQACGVPAIVTDFSAMQEVCGAGWRVGGSRWWTGQQSWQCQPEVADIVQALTRCHSLPKAAREQLSVQAREHAERYDVERVMADHLLPALERCRERFEERKPVQVRPKLKAVA